MITKYIFCIEYISTTTTTFTNITITCKYHGTTATYNLYV